ncbi:MAG: DUF4835 family protein [Paludibacteraceae bacterium]|nr:DUF4835 family protein [Paludibacteraceae bacterium]
MNMRFVHYIYVFVLSILTFSVASAQEMNCRVNISSDKIEGTNKDVFTTLTNDLNDFLNSTKWTDAVFESEERIECNFNIELESVSGDNYSGRLTIQASRPVYNSSYTTTLFNFSDQKFKFKYAEFDKFQFNENEYESNLLSVLAFYVNVVLAINFDSYSRYGGTKYFERAELIANVARSSDDDGWKAFESDRNRYALITGYLDSNLRQLRDVYYEYHRLGLDECAGSVEKGKAKIYSLVPYLKEMNSAKPFNVVLQLFVETKLDELVDMFSNSPSKERKEVYDMILAIHPTKTQKAAELLSEK